MVYRFHSSLLQHIPLVQRKKNMQNSIHNHLLLKVFSMEKKKEEEDEGGIQERESGFLRISQ